MRSFGYICIIYIVLHHIKTTFHGNIFTNFYCVLFSFSVLRTAGGVGGCRGVGGLLSFVYIYSDTEILSDFY